MATLQEPTAARINSRVPTAPGHREEFDGIITQAWIDLNKAETGNGALVIVAKKTVNDALDAAGYDITSLSSADAAAGDHAADCLCIYLFLRDYWAAYPQKGKDCEPWEMTRRRLNFWRGQFCDKLAGLNATNAEYCTLALDLASVENITHCD